MIISDRSVFRMTYIGAPAVFNITEVQPDLGSPYPASAARIGDSVFYISHKGFVELTGNGTGANFIGAGKVDQFFQDDFDPDYPEKISCVADPKGNRVFWLYPGASNTSGRGNKIICYDRTFQKWSLAEEEAHILLYAKGIDPTLDELDALGYTDIDTMTVSLDSDQFKAQSLQLAAFDEDFKMGFFRGLNKSATLTTKEVELNEGHQTALKAFLPLIDQATVTAEVGTRDRQSDGSAYGSSVSQSASGRFTTRARAKYHKFRLTVTGDNWTEAMGVQVLPEDAPRAGRRG